MSQNKGLHIVTFLLLVVGGLNWLLLGVFGWEIGELFGGSSAMISRVIYVLVGLSAIYELATHKASCKACSGKKMDKPADPAPSSDMGSGGMSSSGSDQGDSNTPGM